MKAYRIISAIITLILIVNLFSCDGTHSGKGSHSQKTPEGEEQQPVVYVYSVNQKKLHLPSCAFVSKINPELIKEYKDDIGPLLADGYTLCSFCLLQDSSKEEKEEEEEEFVPDPDEVPPEEATFLVNRSNLKIHEKDCSTISTMSEKNIKYTCLTYEELIANDHIPCGTCMPAEYEEYVEAHPEKFEK